MSSMTRKHFKAIADTVLATRQRIEKMYDNNELSLDAKQDCIAMLNNQAEALANMCRNDNALFNRQKFMEACGF